MNIEEGNALVKRVESVLLSCETENHLFGAIKYLLLAHRRMNKTVGIVDKSHFIPITNRAVGYAYCKVGLDLRGVDV